MSSAARAREVMDLDLDVDDTRHPPISSVIKLEAPRIKEAGMHWIARAEPLLNKLLGKLGEAAAGGQVTSRDQLWNVDSGASAKKPDKREEVLLASMEKFAAISSLGQEFHRWKLKTSEEYKLKYKAADRDGKEEFRKEWATTMHKNHVSRKTYQKSFERVDIKRGTYKPFSKWVQDQGGDEDAFQGCLKGAEKMLKMKGGWVRKNPVTERLEFFDLELGSEELMSESWSLYQEQSDEPVDGGSEAPSDPAEAAGSPRAAAVGALDAGVRGEPKAKGKTKAKAKAGNRGSTKSRGEIEEMMVECRQEVAPYMRAITAAKAIIESYQRGPGQSNYSRASKNNIDKLNELLRVVVIDDEDALQVSARDLAELRWTWDAHRLLSAMKAFHATATSAPLKVLEKEVAVFHRRQDADFVRPKPPPGNKRKVAKMAAA